MPDQSADEELNDELTVAVLRTLLAERDQKIAQLEARCGVLLAERRAFRRALGVLMNAPEP